MSNISDNLIRQKNLKILRKAMRKAGTVTKPQLSELTGLSLVTVNALMRELVEANEVFEGKIAKPQIGRPAKTYFLNDEYKLALIICIYNSEHADMADIMVCDLAGKPLVSFTRQVILNGESTFDEDIECLIKQHPAISVISFGIPGAIVDGELVMTEHYPALNGVRLGEYIEKKHKIKVVVENDARAAILGYCDTHPECSEKCVAGIYFPRKSYLGSGIYLNGGLMKGAGGLAGEIAYLPREVDWSEFEYNKEKINDWLVYIIKSYMCIINPDKVVIYVELPDLELPNMESVCKSNYDLRMIPEITFGDNFRYDYMRGLMCLALNELES